MKHSPTKTNTSVVIPTYNEAGSIEALIMRTHTALYSLVDAYEIIVVDDHSTDDTASIAASLSNRYPVVVIQKNGIKGKSYSLLQGFELARYPCIVMIDGDLQYPPEAIPEMLTTLQDNMVDIVVGNRVVSDTSFIRRVLSVIGRSVYGRLLLGSGLDVQSGLKLFKKTILSDVELNPTPWTFDMEFLLKARQAGYQIGTSDIKLSKRTYGSSKVNTLKTGLEIVIRALQLKLQSKVIANKPRPRPTPDHEKLRG